MNNSSVILTPTIDLPNINEMTPQSPFINLGRYFLTYPNLNSLQFSKTLN